MEFKHSLNETVDSACKNKQTCLICLKSKGEKTKHTTTDNNVMGGFKRPCAMYFNFICF